jgi:hypothetical protein
LCHELADETFTTDALTPENATPDKVKPIVIDIQVLIEAAVVAGKGKPVGKGDIIVLLSVVINVCAMLLPSRY